jgi:hypothetical protein
MISFVSVFLLFAVVHIILSGWTAERRGRSARFWCWMGAIFGPIAPLVVALLPPASEAGGHPPAALNGSGLWRGTHGRASGERSAGDSRIIVMCATP